MKLVLIESPYAGRVKENLKYLRRCIADSLSRGEAPFASHAIYTQPGVLDDDIPEERSKGIEAGFAWGEKADLVAVYVDYGLSTGMAEGILRAEEAGQTVEYRRIGYYEPV